VRDLLNRRSLLETKLPTKLVINMKNKIQTPKTQGG
jgi:hypothetical protein